MFYIYYLNTFKISEETGYSQEFFTQCVITKHGLDSCMQIL